MNPRSDVFLCRAATLVAISCVVIVAGTAVILARPDLRARVYLAPATSYPVGSSLDLPRDTIRPGIRTVVIFGRSSCQACVASKALHQQVAAAARATSSQVLWVSTAPDDKAEMLHGLELGLNRDEVRVLPAQSLRLMRVPTIVIVDTKGIVMGSWEGTVPTDEHEKLLNLIATR